MSEYPILDLSLLHEITAGDKGLIEELLVLYIDNVRERLERMQDLLEQGDSETIAREIHTIKGSSASVGASQMEQLSKELEVYFHENKEKEFAELFMTVPAIFQAFAERVEEMRKIGFSL